MGNEWERGTNKSSENRFAVHAICLSGAPIYFHEPRKKTFLKKNTERLKFQDFHILHLNADADIEADTRGIAVGLLS